MERLVDYFAVVGYDFGSEDKDETLRGKVVTRIPENDWKEVPYTPGIELFCQPGGWRLTHKKQQPTFHVSVLTNAEGKQCYCAVHCFPEPLRNKSPVHKAKSRSNSICVKKDGETGGTPDTQVVDDHVDDDMCKVTNENEDGFDEDMVEQQKDASQTYAPKCLVLLSRIKDFKVLKNCLGLVYTVYIEGLTMSLENIIAKLLLVKVPPPGSSVLRFSIGAADKQALQVPQTTALPLTRSSVAMLLRQLGILNILNILCAALVDQKLLFYSCSYNRLTEACNALVALMYPFSYSYPYIPILPKHLLECTSSPTPFLIGVHSSFKQNLHELLDVVTVDLDGGVISIPECVTIPMIPDPYYTSVVEALTKVLCPDLVVADHAYPPDHTKSSEPERLDKEIRAIFLRLFCQLLMGYRSCLQVCRIHPKPVIRFQHDQYLVARGFDAITPISNEFVPKLLQSQAFSLFVQEKGPPFRRLDLFDEVVSKTLGKIQSETSNVHEALKNVKEIASELYMNENPNHVPLSERIPKPNEGSMKRLNQPAFPKLSVTAVQTFMEENKAGAEKNHVKRRSPPKCKRVPEGIKPSSFSTWTGTLTSSSRRLEVLRNCLSFIFDSKTLEIKKIFQAVLRALKSRTARCALIQELITYSKSHPQLDNQQFDYIARLINNALQDSSGQLDEHTLAADVLPVITTFYRKLCPTVMQFLYTVVQEHPVWSSSAFWENAFFDDIQNAIQKLYVNKLESSTQKTKSRITSPTKSPLLKAKMALKEGNLKRDNQLCMEIAAIELQDWENRSPTQQEEDCSSEEGVVFSQAMHNAQRMVFMLVPLDASRNNRVKFLRMTVGEENSSNSYFTSSLAGSDTGSLDGESGFDESQDTSGDVAATVSKFVSKFVDRVCTEAYISNDHTKTLINKVPLLVRMQMESLQDVCKESKRLPPVKKPKLLQPSLLVGESLHMPNALRAYLAPDGRSTAVGGEIGGPALLPAEGALFVTTYRVIFIGTPCDALAAEQVVIRSFPVSSLFKMKPFSVNDVPHVAEIDNSLQHGIQLRSTTFQLLLLAFDEEVSTEERDQLQTELHSLRYPPTIEGAFAIKAAIQSRFPQSRHGAAMRNKSDSISSNTSTINASRMGGAKTLMKQAKRRAGLNKTNRISRLIMPDSKSRTLYHTPGTDPSMNVGSTATLSGSRMPVINETMTKTLSEKDTISRLIQRASEDEYKRLGLIQTENSKYRFSRINRMFAVCRTYPMAIIVPMKISDEQVKSIAHCHHQGRFPAIVWQHPSTKAVLLHSSGIRSRTASSLFKHGQSAPMLSNEGTVGSSSDEERFLMSVASLASPLSRPASSLFRPESTSSLSSADEELKLSPSRGGTPATAVTQSVRAPKGRKWGTLGRSNGKNTAEQINKTPILGRRQLVHPNGNGTMVQTALSSDTTSKASLYILGDKAQMKNLKNEPQGKILFVPLELPEPKHIRVGYKSLLKSCLPADLPPSTSLQQQQQQDATNGYLKGVQDSGWLEQVSMLLRASGVVVDVMDIRGASVILAIDDGCDSVPQISSIAQLLLDPYYRTIEGFQVLVEKEWLSFGHRFSHRNRFNDIESSGFTPVFLQFLDAVYQVFAQFPMSFEFNSTFLEVLAYHSVSNRFTTFLLDSDYERLEAGILFDKNESRSSRSPGRHSLTSTSSISSAESVRGDRLIKSLWKYIDCCNKRSPVFLNPLFCPDQPFNQVLRPVSAASRLKIWPYYLCESLSEGPTYDGLMGELNSGTSHNEQEATETSEVWGGATARRVINGCYDNTRDAQPDYISTLLQQIERLNKELGTTDDSWQNTWKTLNTSSHQLSGDITEKTRRAQRDIRSLHTLQTEDIIVKRAAIREESVSSETGFEDIAHTLTPHNSRDAFDTASLYDQFQANTQEVRTFEGNLWKRGAMIKGWKLRFFVLDTTKHELRQYENKGDNVCKSIIDLKDLESVKLSDPISGAPKEVDENAFLEVRVSKRQYHFIAETEEAAKQWVDILQGALQ
uniref:Myotubularin-related protein 13-like n=1 Tax=Phallusia mammillata TaxID=59560 RepID=A0A6F9DR00_9ASCI|nr:myotubularin-related protein 13-like [Phallusia mammillata]